ncbi:257_t:CDS:2 [Ambispora gerdemannii]|uniref:257_t:CDS:1 n=1 Tax=Ambispora gerdemannii TaxID=144530 RepID=A0A9N9CKP3_9GLOM|nr:257_t:CDS:2 [Ambispora gerdemannii]
MKNQEENLKKQFYASPKNSSERASIKNQLTRLQKEKFDKGECGKGISFDAKNEELFERLKNPTGPATDPGVLASQIKEELRAILNGSRKMKSGDRKEIKEAIANLPRKRQEPLDLDKITTRMVRVKREDLNSADFNEIISLIRQVSSFLEEKDKQEQQQTENIKLNNPHLFTQSRCSTDGEYNGRRSGKHNGFNYTIYVPDNHFALTNVLFDDGWGTNSEQRDEIVSDEKQARRLINQGKQVSYQTYVDLNDKISIDHYQENGQLDLAKPVSGINKGLIKNNDHGKSMSGRLITNDNEKAKTSEKIDNEFLLQYFQEKNIKQISLTPDGNLLIEYNSDKTEIINNNQANNQELQKVISYYQKNNQTNLSQQDLISMSDTNSSTTSPKNNHVLLISFGIVGALMVGTAIGL